MWYAAALIGSYMLNSYNQMRTQERQAGSLQDMLANQQGYQGDILSRLQGELGKLQKGSPAKAEATARGQYLDALASALPPGSGGQADADTGGAGSRYTTDRAQAAVGNKQDAQWTADMMSRLTGPSNMRTNEGYDLGKLGNRISMDSNFAQGRAGADKINYGVIQPNATLSMLSQALEQFGSYGLGQYLKNGKPPQQPQGGTGTSDLIDYTPPSNPWGDGGSMYA